MTHERMKTLYDGMLDYITEVVNKEDVEDVLRNIGFTYDEIHDEGFESTLGKAKRLINQFCECEYDHGCEFKDLEHVGLAYTTTTDDQHDLQVEVDLVNYRMVALVDWKEADVIQYDSLEHLIEEELEVLDFENLIIFAEGNWKEAVR